MEKNFLIQEKLGLFKRIILFVKKVFMKKGNKIENEAFDNSYNSKFIEEMKSNKRILELQKEFEFGHINEEDLTQSDRECLKKLYKEQIETLQKNIQLHNKNLDYYEQKIILAKNKIKNRCY